jgi:hypothetical protein
MTARRMVIAALGALLFLGPLCAGLAAAPITLLPIFVASFVLWVVMMRPSVWAEATRGGTPVALAVHPAGVTLVQVLMIFLCFGFGRGLAMLSAPLDIPVWTCVVLTLAAVPLGWALRHPSDDRDAMAALTGSQEQPLGRR